MKFFSNLINFFTGTNIVLNFTPDKSLKNVMKRVRNPRSIPNKDDLFYHKNEYYKVVSVIREYKFIEVVWIIIEKVGDND